MLKLVLIELNYDLIERACLVIRSAVANSMDWSDIELLVKDAQTRGDPVAQSIHGLKLYSNHITMMLKYVNVLLCYVGFICVVFLIESQILVKKTKRKKFLVESVRRKRLVYVFL